MANTIRCKDFEIKSFRYGSRLNGGPEWAYEIIYHHQDGSGRSTRIGGDFFTKEAARKHISKVVEINNRMASDPEFAKAVKERLNSKERK